MSTLNGLAGLEVVRQVGPQKAGIFCLGGLVTEAKMVPDKTHAAEWIIAVDDCPLDCARKIVERAGFAPDQIIKLVQDCGLQKGPPLQHGGDTEIQVAVVQRRILQERIMPHSQERNTHRYIGSTPLGAAALHKCMFARRVSDEQVLG